MFKEISLNPKNEKILGYFDKLIESYSQIISLKSSLDKTSFLISEIRKIFNGSTFILSNTKYKSFQCIYKEKTKEGKIQTASKENIISFKQRAQLLLNINFLLKV